MESAILGAVVGAAVTLVLVAVVLGVRRVVIRGHRTRADLEAMLTAAQQESDQLRHRLDELHALRDGGLAVPRGAEDRAELFPVITSVGRESKPEPLAAPPVPDRLVLSATLGEPLVRAAAFSHGVRRALSAESRNRIWFEVRREVRASRRRRRQLRKRLEREYRANLRAAEPVYVESQA
ncbi:MAG TPA: hypothetical protein VGE14_01645 [Marmoricola sp.]